MAHTTERAERMKYTDVAALPSAAATLAGVEIRSPHDELLGRLAGVLVATESGRSRYVVVDAASRRGPKRYLIPTAMCWFNPDRRVVKSNLTAEILDGMPEFDVGSFEAMSDAQAAEYEDRVLNICCPDLAAARDLWEPPELPEPDDPNWLRFDLESGRRRWTETERAADEPESSRLEQGPEANLLRAGSIAKINPSSLPPDLRKEEARDALDYTATREAIKDVRERERSADEPPERS
jgi:hypothetical protein